MLDNHTHHARPITAAHPLGPLAFRAAARNPASARLIAAGVAAGCATVLVAAASLTPDPRGQGTHEQLGLPPCTMVMFTGYPCPTCGMTTAFAYAVRGRFIAAFSAQPAGLAIALGVMAAFGLSGGTLVTGRVWAVNWYRVTPGRIALVVVLVVLAAWGYKLMLGLLSGALPMRG